MGGNGRNVTDGDKTSSKGVVSKQMHMEMVLQTFLRSHTLIRETTEMNSF